MTAKRAMTAKRKKNPPWGSTVDHWLAEEGVLEEFRAIAIKEVIVWQIQQAMKKKKLPKSKMAELMETSRALLNRLLDPKGGNVTLDTLHRAAHVLGREPGEGSVAPRPARCRCCRTLRRMAADEPWSPASWR